MTIESLLSRDKKKFSEEFIALKNFLEKEGVTHAVGIIGSSRNEQSLPYKDLLTHACLLTQARIGNFAIVSGGTGGGAPEMAFMVGQELGLPTIGVFPETGAQYALEKETQNFSIPTPSHSISETSWGTETPVLISIPDIFIVVGGEWGTLTEVSMIMKKNSSRAKEKLKPLPIIVINGSGKLADNIDQLTAYLPTPSGSVIRVSNSKDLAHHLIQGLQ